MAENLNIQEPVYIPYGDQQIEQNGFMKDIADNINPYVNNLPWSTKKKKKFLEAYLDIVSKGITGADNTSGQWALNLSSNLDLESKSKKDLEIYHEAAYYILLLMLGLPTKDSNKPKSEDLLLYDNAWHKKAFTGFIGNKMFGGQNWDYTLDWDTLDERDKKTGMLGTSKRMLKLADMLEQYSNSLEENKYNFEGTAFKDLEDLKTRLNTAASSLRQGELNLNVKDALYLAGLNWRDYLHDGGDEQVGVDANGNPITRRQYLEALLEKEIAEAQERVALERQSLLNNLRANMGVLNVLGGIHAVEARSKSLEYSNYLANTYGVGLLGFNNVNNAIQNLIEKGRTLGLNSSEKKLLGNFLYYVRTNNPNYLKSNLTDLEWNELNKHLNLGSKNRAGYVRLPWQTSDGRYTFADDKGNLYFMKSSNLLKLSNVPFKGGAAYLQYRKNFLKSKNQIALENTLGENNGLTADMKADLIAMGLDLTSAATAFAPGYGTLASAVSGIGATISGAVADRMREESWGSTLGTAGFGLSMDILGLIPGVGVGAKAAKIAKVVSKGAKWIGPALGGLAAMSYGPGAISAYKKFTSGNKDAITAEELRDFTYAIRAIAAGGIRKAGTTYQGNRTLAKAIKGKDTIGTTAKGLRATISSEKTSASITTRNGKNIKLTEEEFKTLSSNASREAKAKIIAEAAKKQKINLEGDEIEWKGLNPVKGRFKTSEKSSKLKGLNESIESSQIKWKTTSKDYKGIRRFSNENLLRGFTTISGTNTGIWKIINDRWKGNDILNSPVRKFYSSPSIKVSLKPSEPKSLPAPTKLKELPAPNLVSNKDIIGKNNISSKKSIRDSQKEINNFIDSYGLSSKRKPSSFKGGYDSSKTLKVGKHSFTLLADKGNIPFVFDNSSPKEIKVTIGNQSKTFESLELARQYAARNVYSIFKESEYTKTAEILKELKSKGIFKQGGTIHQDLYTTISNFLKTLI